MILYSVFLVDPMLDHFAREALLQQNHRLCVYRDIVIMQGLQADDEGIGLGAAIEPKN